MRVVRLGREEAYELPTIVKLFEAAFEGLAFPDALAVLRWYQALAERPEVCVLIALDGSDAVGLFTVEEGDSPLAAYPIVTHVYAAVPGAYNLMADAFREWSLERGHTRFAFLNRSGASDEAYLRKIRRWHLRGHVDASLVVCLWGEAPAGDEACLDRTAKARVEAGPPTKRPSFTSASERTSLPSSTSESEATSVVSRVLSWLRSRKTKRTPSGS